MKMSAMIAACGLAVGLATSAMAQVTVNSLAVQTGTIQTGGPRQGVNGNLFFNIDGLATGFASYGVARWDLTQARADLDAALGAGQWQVTAIELEMTQDNAAFSAAGAVSVYYSTDDTTDCKSAAPTSPLAHPFFDPILLTPDLALGNGGNAILNYGFVVGATADLDRYTQAGGTHAGGAVNPAEALALATDLVQDVTAQNMLTLVFVDVDPSVAATYRGQEYFAGPPERFQPRLIITATGTGGGGCYANCDGSTGSPRLTANDFQCFINKYAGNESYANCDGSTGTPALTANDFQCFINKYAANESYANCDGSTGTPALTANDFQCFIDSYASGCS